MKIRSLLMAVVLASCASLGLARDICHCKGYGGPGGPCHSGPGGSGEDCPSVCR